MKLIRIPGASVAYLINTIATVGLQFNLPRTEFTLRIVFTNGDVKNYILPTAVESTAQNMFDNFIRDFNQLS